VRSVRVRVLSLPASNACRFFLLSRGVVFGLWEYLFRESTGDPRRPGGAHRVEPFPISTQPTSIHSHTCASLLGLTPRRFVSFSLFVGMTKKYAILCPPTPILHQKCNVPVLGLTLRRGRSLGNPNIGYVER
jgi:hypothetical protein